MKGYEARETDRQFLPMLPVCARIDGRSFHTFTRGFKRPFDELLSELFRHTTKALVKETGAVIGYTQSDEISLVLHAPDPDSQIFFEGKIFKLTSVLASIATAAFNGMLMRHVYTHPDDVPSAVSKLATFDCRVWQVPDRWEAVNTLLWREKDAIKNSISMAASSVYSHAELEGKSGAEKQEMLFKKGINWNDYPKWAKSGTYYRRSTAARTLTPEELAVIPEKHRPPATEQVLRSDIVAWPFELGKISNKVEAVFGDVKPVLLSDLAAEKA